MTTNHDAIRSDLLRRFEAAGIDPHDEYDFPSRMIECDSCGEVVAIFFEVLPAGCICTYNYCEDCIGSRYEN